MFNIYFLHGTIMLHTICTNQLFTSSTHCFASSHTKRFVTVITHRMVKLTPLTLQHTVLASLLVYQLFTYIITVIIDITEV